MITKLLKKENWNAACPHCGNVNSDVWICELDSVIGTRYAYMCTICERLLGISIDKNTILPLVSDNKSTLDHLQNNNLN